MSWRLSSWRLFSVLPGKVPLSISLTASKQVLRLNFEKNVVRNDVKSKGVGIEEKDRRILLKHLRIH